MKQKRKVKSLLPQRKDRKTSFLTTLLLVLSTILCIGSASLLTSSVFAENVIEVTFTGLSDNMEAVYNLKFVDPENLSGDGVADVYFHDNSLYISPSPVIVSGSSDSTPANRVKTGVYSHILGGEKNTIYSENVTIIAGKHNIVSGGSNSTILGGMDNELGTGAVLIGGRINVVEDNKEGVVFIGGYQNDIEGNYTNRNIFVLGGENNKVNTTGENMIIGGSGVNISGSEINNIFVFSSPRPFTPISGKTFYLNMENGVGIGTGGVPRGLAVNGAIKLSYTNATKRFCNSGNLGVIYSLNGCLIGCTKTSLVKQETADAPFELLSLNESCKSALSGDIKNGDIFYQEEEIPETPSYTGYCTHVNFTGHTVPCSTPEVYKNVIFETSIVDNGECSNKIGPRLGENKCVFECEGGYHLGYDAEYGTGCYKDCTLGVNKTIKHNNTVTGYHFSQVVCSDGSNFKTCDTARNNKNKKTLICKNGTLFINGTNTPATDYTEPSCTLYGGYYCARNGYNISYSALTTKETSFKGKSIMYDANYSKAYIKGKFGSLFNWKNYNNTLNSFNGRNQNRSLITTTTARGIYQLCIDFNGDWEADKNPSIYLKKGSNTDCLHNHDVVYRYKTIECNPGYVLSGDRCRPKCDSFLSGDSKTYTYGTVLTGYLNNPVSCPNESCEYAAFKCVDNGEIRGVWEPIAGFKGKNPEDYKYERCDVNTKTCGEGFVLQAGDLERFKNRDFTGYQNSIYTGCTIIERNNGNCETGSTYYKLDGCKRDYHTENNEYCIYNYRSEPCPDKPDNAVRVQEDSTGRNGITLTPGRYGQSWDEDAWTTDVQPGSACKWKCVDGARLEGKDKCVIDGECSDNEKFECKNGNPSNQKTGDNNEGYYWDCVSYDEDDGGKTESCHLCNDGYSYSGTTHKCEPTKYDCEGPMPAPIGAAGYKFGPATYTYGHMPTRWTYTGGTPTECEYTCDDSVGYYNIGGYCRNITSFCSETEKNGCAEPANYTNEGGDESKYTWDCAVNGKIVEVGCFMCKDGYKKQNGTCVPNNNCPSGQYSSLSECKAARTDGLDSCDDLGNGCYKLFYSCKSSEGYIKEVDNLSEDYPGCSCNWCCSDENSIYYLGSYWCCECDDSYNGNNGNNMDCVEKGTCKMDIMYRVDAPSYDKVSVCTSPECKTIVFISKKDVYGDAYLKNKIGTTVEYGQPIGCTDISRGQPITRILKVIDYNNPSNSYFAGALECTSDFYDYGNGN